MKSTRAGVLPLVALATACFMASTGAPGARAATPVACDTAPDGEDGRTFRCRLDPASAGPRAYRFEANFEGGHDDTVAWMDATLDAAPLACAAGSKPRLMGEDGDVAVFCSFALPPGAPPAVLDVKVKWSHARYTRASLVAE